MHKNKQTTKKQKNPCLLFLFWTIMATTTCQLKTSSKLCNAVGSEQLLLRSDQLFSEA